jgi:hypothetical protein
MQIAIKEAKVTITGSQGISQAFPISDVVVEMRSQEAFKGFH